MKCCVCDEELPCSTTWAVALAGDPPPPLYLLPCAEPGCLNPRHARGLCSIHYHRMRHRERRDA